MKPPSRSRNIPSRFLEIKKTEPISRFRPACQRLEERRLLLALKHQQRLNTELDFLALRKKVPKWSLLQIQNFIKFLKRCVVKRVYCQVQRQRRQEQKNKVPIELWAEQAQKMAGVHVETISSAFSQMLVIAATEPCSLQDSDPPLTTDSQRPLTSGLRTIPLRPLPKSYTGLPSPVIIPPEQACKTPQSHGKDAASSPSAKTTTVASQSAVAEEEQSELIEKTEANKDPAMSSTSATPKSLSQPVSKPTRPVSASSAVPSLTSGSVQPDKQPDIGQSEQAWKHRPMGMKSVVDFGKIYKFISNIISSKHTEPLTSMESAVLLDLLMSLPEELPLLDCKELQNHLLQVYAHLNTPAVTLSSEKGPAVDTSSTRETVPQTSRTDHHVKGPDVSLQTQTVQSTRQEIVQNGEVTEQLKATEQNVTGAWATASQCPLNPFMVPVALLKRK